MYSSNLAFVYKTEIQKLLYQSCPTSISFLNTGHSISVLIIYIKDNCPSVARPTLENCTCLHYAAFIHIFRSQSQNILLWRIGHFPYHFMHSYRLEHSPTISSQLVFFGNKPLISLSCCKYQAGLFTFIIYNAPFSIHIK